MRHGYYVVRFDYRRLQKDIGLKVPEIQKQFRQHFGLEIARCSIYAWFQRGCIPLERLTQLITLVRLETDRKLDLWRYVIVQLPRKKAA